MIHLHTWKTPNGRKAAIMLEETGLPYAVHPVNIGEDEQFDPAFLSLAPNNKIPAIVDEEGVDGRLTLFETGAILNYLAAKAQMLRPHGGQAALDCQAWLFWSCTGLSPMLGQWNYFAVRAKEKTPAAVERFTTEAARLFGVLEARLAEGPFLAGGDYSIADISTFAWTQPVLPKFREVAPDALGPTPNVDRWLEETGARPAVKRGLQVP